MKKVLSMICLFVMIFSCSAMADENLQEIKFRGMEFGSAASDIAIIVNEENNGPFFLSQGDPLYSYSPQDIAYTCITLLADGFQVNENNYDAIRVEREDSMEIAGHKTRGGMLCFVKPVVNGVIVENNMESLFYAGAYVFDISAKEDLKNKLTVLYGEPEKGKYNKAEMHTWYGKNNTAIYMTEASAISNFLGLTYAWLEFENIFNETCAYLEQQNQPAETTASTYGL